MNIFRNILAIIIGFVVGSVVNMTLIIVGPFVIPTPEGFDSSTMESMSETAHLLEAKHMVFPFLAHALGTFVGALVAFLVAASYRSVFAYAMGAWFLLGGITMTFMIPAPLWFDVLDLVGAYIPMAWIGAQLGKSITGPAAVAPEQESAD